MAHIHYYASIADAAGVREEEIELPGPVSAPQLRDLLKEGKDAEFARLISVCAVIVASKRLPEDIAVDLAPDTVIDILPPFAGG